MVRYRYKAKNNDGKVIRGVFYVDNEEDLRDILANQGYFLVKGHKIKASLRFKGRQMAHTELGREVLEKFAQELSDVAVVESAPKLEGRNMTMILAPKK